MPPPRVMMQFVDFRKHPKLLRGPNDKKTKSEVNSSRLSKPHIVRSAPLADWIAAGTLLLNFWHP